MPLLRLDQISIEFGHQPLLVNVDMVVEEDERICLIGRNGAGKSTLLKIIAGDLLPDSGEVVRRELLRIARLEQDLPAAQSETVAAVLRGGLAEQTRRIEQYRALAASAPQAAGLREMETLHAAIEAAGGWEIDRQVATVASQLDLPLEQTMETLSGGWRRRVALGRALVSRPDLLLLDEPTNHLDIHTIEWLEQQIRGYGGSVIFITHDRHFLRKLATRVVDIDRGRVRTWPGNYDNYLRLKEAAEEKEATDNALFDARLAGEERWVRQGIKARRTRNEGRVRALEAMRRERARRIDKPGKAQIAAQSAERSGRKVIEAYNVTHGFDGEPLIRDFKLKVMRGDRIALIGNNGVGKSTLLQILLGRLSPDQGTVKLGTNLEIGYFDQVRRRLEPDKTVAYNVGEGREYIRINDRERHIIGYLKHFLFSPARARSKVRDLSGGERNRVLLAKLFARPTNLLVLDEPTNDLDVEMLEVLEDRLVRYDGTLIVVSHDREFIDNVVTTTLVFEGDGRVRQYHGGYSDWLARNRQLQVADELDRASSPSPSQHRADTAAGKSAGTAAAGRLSYKYQRELDQLTEQIAALEARVTALQEALADPAFYDRPFEQTQPVMDELTETQQTLDQATERWFELEEMKARPA